jgi:PAS domain S-box-containing protein
MKPHVMLFPGTFTALLSNASISFKKKESSAKWLINLSAAPDKGRIPFALYETQGGTFLDRFVIASKFFFSKITATVLFVFSLANTYKVHWIHLLRPGMFSIKPQGLSNYSGLLLAGFLAPLGFCFFPGLNRVTMIKISPILLTGYSIGIISLACGLFRKQPILNAARLTREAVIEKIDDGWMVVDANQRITDINPAAERILGISRKEVYGQRISDILVEWPNIIKTSEAIKELEMRQSIKEQNKWRYISMRISKLTDQHQAILGYLIVWRDITQHKLVENARQKARDEMFVLLNGISSAASHAMSLDDFLLESINQIICTFQSQAIGVFLINQDTKEVKEQTIHLAAQMGFSNAALQSMRNLPTSSELWRQITHTNQHLLIDNLRNNPLLHPRMRELDYSCILILPLSIRTEETQKFLGCIALAKNEKQNFTQDEIIRLSIISEQISMLIDNNRRRQFSIVLSERQRLQRDLHDSVSQKLYGLVAISEAAQAALEAGSKINPSQILAKMGDHARQAVKEMRLFLYEMQPVDLEKEGLVSVLNHRLAAVEGRADIKVRLLADENISLSKNNEIALYFIAQEALNNILKHAHAKSVSIILKKTRKKIILEILDDGIGFDMKKVDGGGFGLRNMRERVSQIGGILKITSKPRDGTKITVQVFKEDIRP